MTRRQQRFHQRYGPSALVTGASSGIGREIAWRLAEAGFDLVLVARRETLPRELAAEMTSRHTIDVSVLPIDLARRDGVDDHVDATVGKDIGLYVAAAGFGTSGRFLDAEVEQEREMLRLNCEAVLTTSVVFGRRLVRGAPSRDRDRRRRRAHHRRLALMRVRSVAVGRTRTAATLNNKPGAAVRFSGGNSRTTRPPASTPGLTVELSRDQVLLMGRRRGRALGQGAGGSQPVGSGPGGPSGR